MAPKFMRAVHSRTASRCRVLYSENLQHNQLVADTLEIVNLFLAVTMQSALTQRNETVIPHGVLLPLH